MSARRCSRNCGRSWRPALRTSSSRRCDASSDGPRVELGAQLGAASGSPRPRPPRPPRATASAPRARRSAAASRSTRVAGPRRGCARRCRARWPSCADRPAIRASASAPAVNVASCWSSRWCSACSASRAASSSDARRGGGCVAGEEVRLGDRGALARLVERSSRRTATDDAEAPAGRTEPIALRRDDDQRPG